MLTILMRMKDKYDDIQILKHIAVDNDYEFELTDKITSVKEIRH